MRHIVALQQTKWLAVETPSLLLWVNAVSRRKLRRAVSPSVTANLAENKNKNCGHPRGDPHLALQLPFNFFIYQVADPRGSTAALLTAFLLSCNQPSVDLSPSLAPSGSRKHIWNLNPSIHSSIVSKRSLLAFNMAGVFCSLSHLLQGKGSVAPWPSQQCWDHVEVQRT